ncbi:MAG: DUF2182 domain-containing protein [Chloroflexota bacterium]|nr:DUF2182 domain-containing protein [Chloroflexota bacterium]
MAMRGMTEQGQRASALRQGLAANWPWLLVAAAWALAIIATLTGRRELIDHHFLLEESGLPWPVAALVFLACWQVMIAAMMLPASMPAFNLLLGGARPHLARAQAAFLASYAALWAAFALLAFAGDTLIHHTVDVWPWLAAHTFVIGATTLTIAGAFQFSRLKARCLAACHTPLALVASGYRADARLAWLLGARHGLASVGCCWALMLIMFGVGVGGPGWMAALTVAMLVEQRFAAARAPRLALGVALLALALVWLARPAWLPTSAA